jgi:hypothetical protein
MELGKPPNFMDFYQGWLKEQIERHGHDSDYIIYALKDCEYCGECEECLKAKEEAAIEYGLVNPGVWNPGWISVYRTSRRYGGPEEGGWYYTHYSHLASIPFIDAATRVDAVSLAGKCYSGKEIHKCTEWFIPGHKETLIAPHYR